MANVKYIVTFSLYCQQIDRRASLRGHFSVLVAPFLPSGQYNHIVVLMWQPAAQCLIQSGNHNMFKIQSQSETHPKVVLGWNACYQCRWPWSRGRQRYIFTLLVKNCLAMGIFWKCFRKIRSNNAVLRKALVKLAC